MTQLSIESVRVSDVKALVFDLGNVLIEIDFMRCVRFWSRRADVPPAQIITRFRIDRHYEAFERGQLPAAAYFDVLRRQLGIELDDREMAAGWNRIIRGEKPGIRACILQLKPHFPLYVLTNTNAVHTAEWETRHRSLLKYFSHVFISSVMGCRKPEDAVYQRVIDAIGVPAGQILFMDDASENVQGAIAAGMQGFRAEGPDGIINITAELTNDVRLNRIEPPAARKATSGADVR